MPVLFLFALQFMFEVLLGLSVVLAFLAVAPALRDQRPRWGWFGVAVGVGLLTKGPVMLLHVAFPLLCAPWWSRYARRDRWRWFRGALLGVGIGSAMLAAWLVPALLFGGERYRSEVLWMQTGGRVVDSFDHARPIWWYLPVLLGLLFPWLYWSAWWRGLARLHRDIEPGTRFLLAWLIPTLLCFALVSGKQFYYLIPWLAGAAVLIARALDDAAPVAPRARVSWGLLPFALLLLGAAGAWIYVGHIGSPGGLANRWFSAFVEAPIGYALGIALLGALLLAPLRGPAAAAAPRLAAASLLAFTLGHAAFSASLWPYFDLTPVAQLIHQAQAENRTVATLDKYEDEYHFLGRLREPLLQLQDAQAPAWAVAHPDDVLVTRPSRHAARPNAQPIFSAEFRERIVQVWRAGDWLEAQKEGD
jgi:4-amino-4-deoxy-L-arabinose transferase-like glycosyltransferase